MNKSRATIVALSVALLGSNALWAYKSFDLAVSASYREAALQEHHQALAQTLAIVPIAVRPDSTAEQVVKAAASAAHSPDTFKKDGCVWVGRVGLRFDEAGRLTEVRPAWSPF